MMAELLQRTANDAIGHHVAGAKLQADLGIGARPHRRDIEVDQQLGLQIALPQAGPLDRPPVPVRDGYAPH